MWGGAGSGDTMRANLEAFRRWRLVPRHLRDTSDRDLAVEVLGTRLAAPVMLAPIGVQEIVHPDGELASARGAAAAGHRRWWRRRRRRDPLEAVAAEHGDLPRWFQLYWPKDPELMRSLVGARGGRGLRRDRGHARHDPPRLPADRPGHAATCRSSAAWASRSSPRTRSSARGWTSRRRRTSAPRSASGSALVNEVITWDDLPDLRAATDLPILLKGILDPDDARRAREAGVDGVIVSNHGGRQVDGAIAALDALPDVAGEVGGDMAVLFDSGIRGGADAAKALALGAEAILLGRPYLWGLTLGGADGVEHVLRMLLAELDLTMALCGASTRGGADAGPAQAPRALTKVTSVT